MYLYLGGNDVVREENIIGIFDLDTTTVSKKSRDFINNAEKTGKTVYSSYDLPKAFVLTAEQNKTCKKIDMNEKIYITSLSVNTLKKRTKTESI